MKRIHAKIGTHPAVFIDVVNVRVRNVFVPADYFEYEVGDRIQFKETPDQSDWQLSGGVIDNITIVDGQPFYWIERM